MTIKESHVDVLIVGAGPAGLMMATWLAKTGVNYRIIDRRNTKIFNGQADGLQTRTMEIFDSLGFGDRTVRESNLMPELHLWNPDEHGIIRRSDTLHITAPGLSRFQQTVLNQGRIERFFLDEIANCGGNTVERAVLPTKLVIDQSLVEDANAYPITVNLRHLSEEEATPRQVGIAANGEGIQDGIFRSNLASDDTQELIRSSELSAKANQEEIVKAKYMLGADGGHSWTRNELGFTMEGDSTDYIWGVIDMIPITDFPDIRIACTIHSADAGSVLQIPREGQLVRLYVQLISTEKIGEEGARFDKSHITPESILAAAQRIYAPYTMNYRILNWWTAYQVGQRVGNSFSAFERVFLAGDAVHTHSPKAGQGMNTSLQDTYNLGWKVASVVKGLADPSILKTYQSERRRIAQDLIDFDRRYAKLFSGKPAKDLGDLGGVNMDDFKNILEKNILFISGLAVNYGASVVVAKQGSTEEQGDGTNVSLAAKFHVISDQSLAEGIPLGKRMPSTKVLNQASGCPLHFQELLQSNGRWRVVFFTGDIHQPDQRKKLDAVGAALEKDTSFRNRFTPTTAAYDSMFEILAVHTSRRLETTIFDFPEPFRDLDQMYGYDYSKIYADDEYPYEPHQKIYEAFSISEKGCAVIIRPDQYVSYVGPMEDVDALNTFFNGFMLTPEKHGVEGAASGKVNGA